MRTLPPLFGSIVFVFAWVVLVPCSPAVADGVPEIAPGSWTLAILPDTQNYAQDYPEYFTAQTQWIAFHKASQNIQFVLHEGDIVNDNNPIQWGNAKASLDILSDNNVPFALAVGNHDYTAGGVTRDGSLFNRRSFYGPGSPYALQSTIGGFFEARKTDNSYHTFSAGGEDWLVLSLEFGPRDQVVDWAKTVMEANPGRKAILLTHAYLSGNARYDWATKGTKQPGNPHASPAAALPGGVNDGEQLWDKLVSQYENFEFVFAGHSLSNRGAGYLASEGNNGNLVHQMLANYQSPLLPEGGQGFLRLLEFKEDGETVDVRTFSPVLGEFNEGPDQQFTLKRNLVLLKNP